MNLKEIRDYEGFEVEITTFDGKKHFGILEILDENTITVGFMTFIDISDVKNVRLLKC